MFEKYLDPHLFFKGSYVSDARSDFFLYQEMSYLYYIKDFFEVSYKPLNHASLIGRHVVSSPLLPFMKTSLGRAGVAGIDIFERYTHRYRKPSFGFDTITSSGKRVYQVKEVIKSDKAFCRLIHFEKTYIESEFSRGKAPEFFPKVLVAAPYSGHYATLLKDTVLSLLKDHDVYITDWANARDVPLFEGKFTLENYMTYLIDFIRLIDDEVNMVAVCQPSVPLLATTALLSSAGEGDRLKSMTLMGGPIDTRVNPTKVNKLAHEKPLSWFEQSVIGRVPGYYPGAGRRVIPGFLMLTGFMSLNLERHMMAPASLFNHLVRGDLESAENHRSFYDEYRSVLDLPADYFLDSVKTAFQEHLLPKGEMRYKGELIDPKAIEKTGLLTIEGEKDDISGVGQTKAAHDLCTRIPGDSKKHYLQKGVGHYGVFNGKRWREEIMPHLHTFIRRDASPKLVVKAG